MHLNQDTGAELLVWLQFLSQWNRTHSWKQIVTYSQMCQALWVLEATMKGNGLAPVDSLTCSAQIRVTICQAPYQSPNFQGCLPGLQAGENTFWSEAISRSTYQVYQSGFHAIKHSLAAYDLCWEPCW